MNDMEQVPLQSAERAEEAGRLPRDHLSHGGARGELVLVKISKRATRVAAATIGRAIAEGKAES